MTAFGYVDDVGPRGWDVTHGDGVTYEIVRRLDFHTARRLVDHEHAAGRFATMDPTARAKGNAR